MDNGWIKLYRKSKINPLMRDFTAWGIFTWILLTVDRKTGKTLTGRNWASEYFGIKPTTFRDAIYRLRDKYKVIATSSDNKKTEISVLNWAKYQDVNSLTPSPTPTKRQPDATIQEVRIKNTNKDTNVSAKPSLLILTKNQKESLRKKYPYLDFDYEYDKFKVWQEAEGKQFPNTLKRFEKWLMDAQGWQEKKTNVIIEDPIFKRLLPIYHATIGREWEIKDSLIDRLNDKYPLYKFTKEWEEAKKILKNTTSATLDINEPHVL